MAIADDDITTAIDVTAFWSHKLRALAAHASQLDAAALLQTFRASAVSTGYVEEFVRMHPPGARDFTAVERDLFDPSTSGATDRWSAPAPPPEAR
jgi:LmbE family N-acetylglucosaminyl deacetylase